MKIVDRSTFLTLPAGTVYAKGTPWVFGSLCFKGDTTGNDWWYVDPCWIESEGSHEVFDLLDEMKNTGSSQPMESAVSRDGRYDAEAIFLVFELPDLKALHEMVGKAVEVAATPRT